MQVPVAPRVLAVLVAHDGATWLPAALDALEAQTHPNLDIVAVDNASTDGSREILIERLGTDRVLVADIDLGFGAAVAMALDARAPDAPYVWLLHDDAAFLPDALSHLVAKLQSEPRVSVAGPKLRDWMDGDRLQSVGLTIDMTGRVETGIDPGELDQGQRDHDRRTLYVSTAGMLVRRRTFDELGGFDRRFHIFRDDLDLCWRVWLADEEVEIVPAALGAHVGAAAEYIRLGQTVHLGPRYFDERNALASLLKNYGTARLPLVVLLYFVVGIAKVAGFVLTRRLADAWQTIRAWVWNVRRLRETWRLRRVIQQQRRRTDSELKELFGRITPRVRAYAEAIAYWVAGGDTTPVAQPEPDEVAKPESGSRLVRFARRRPVVVAGTLLIGAIVAGAWPLLVPGELRGGSLAPWPSLSAAFLTDYLSGWHDAGAFGTSEAPSPVQALLGFLHAVAGGSTYLAPRLLIFGSLVAAWVFALRAAQPASPRRVPRVAAATAYVLSPPALAALATAQVGAMVTLAVLPGIVAAGLAMADPASTPGRAWRAVSGLVLLGAVGIAFEPVLAPALVAAGLLVVITSMVAGSQGWRRVLAARVAVAVAGPFVLLLPWSVSLLDVVSGPLAVQTGAAGGELWRWLALSPDLIGFSGLLAGAGFVVAGVLGLLLGISRSPRTVATFWAVAVLGAVAGWLLGRVGAYAWPGLPLLLTAAAYAGLFALAFAAAEEQLARHGFGWRQVGAGVTALTVLVSIGTVVVGLARSPLEAYAVDEPPLPAFVTAAAEQSEPFRVLVLADRPDGVEWEVVDGSGPTMAASGMPSSPVLEHVDDVVTQITNRHDPSAAARLGPLNIRYVFVPEGGTSPALDAALRGQFELEPRPVLEGRVYNVIGWLPRASVVTPAVAWDVVEAGAHTDAAEPTVLERRAPGVYSGRSEVTGPVILSEYDDGMWRITADGSPVTISSRAGSPYVVSVPVSADAEIEIRHDATATRNFEVTGQALALLLVISLALRPPRFARRDTRTQTSARPQLTGSEADR